MVDEIEKELIGVKRIDEEKILRSLRNMIEEKMSNNE